MDSSNEPKKSATVAEIDIEKYNKFCGALRVVSLALMELNKQAIDLLNSFKSK